MFIIEDGKAYKVEGDNASRVKFDDEGNMLLDEEDKIKTKGKKTSTYDEVYRRLNVAYAIEMAKLKKSENKEIQTLKERIEILEGENEKLKKQLQEKKEKTSKK